MRYHINDIVNLCNYFFFMVGFYQIYGLCKSHPINIQTINRNDNVLTIGQFIITLRIILYIYNNS